MSEIATSRAATTQGYSCNGCGMWVYPGTTHSCVWRIGVSDHPFRPLPVTTIVATQLTDEDIERIAKRVAELLAERLADK